MASPQIISLRFSTMFVLGAADAVASGLPPLARTTFKGLVKFAAAHMSDLKQADVNALSNSFGNFDRAVGLGWLLFDAVSPVGTPLCARASAFAIGSKARREAGNIKTEIRNAKLKAQRAWGSDITGRPACPGDRPACCWGLRPARRVRSPPCWAPVPALQPGGPDRARLDPAHGREQGYRIHLQLPLHQPSGTEGDTILWKLVEPHVSLQNVVSETKHWATLGPCYSAPVRGPS